jgi:hypothetical protein
MGTLICHSRKGHFDHLNLTMPEEPLDACADAGCGVPCDVDRISEQYGRLML